MENTTMIQFEKWVNNKIMNTIDSVEFPEDYDKEDLVPFISYSSLEEKDIYFIVNTESVSYYFYYNSYFTSDEGTDYYDFELAKILDKTA